MLESFCAESAVLAAYPWCPFHLSSWASCIYSLLYPSPYFYEVPQDLPFFAVDQDGSTSSRQLLRSLDAHGRGTACIAMPIWGRPLPTCGRVTWWAASWCRGILSGDCCAGGTPLVPVCREAAAHLLSYGMLVQGGRLATENLGAGARVERLRKQGVPESAALALQVRGRIDARC